MPILNIRTETKTKKGEVNPAPDGLAASGPVLPVTITLSDKAMRSYAETGEQPLPAVNGLAMIDTGATTTCFDEAAAKKAGLPTIGVTSMSSASHPNHEVPLFSGKITTPTVTINVEKGMGANLSAVSNGLIALIGRDVLKSAVLVYNGPDGHFSLSI